MRRLDGRLFLRERRKVRAPQGSVTGNARHPAKGGVGQSLATSYNTKVARDPERQSSKKAGARESHRDELGRRCSNVTA